MNRRWTSYAVNVFLLAIALVTADDVPIKLEKHLQPLDVGINPKYDLLPDDPYLCSRNCTKYPEARICYYQLVVEQYHAMGPACKNCPINKADCYSPQCITADGIERTVLSFNRMIPGPAFHICFGDRVIADVDNKMPAREVTIHWHGQLQKTSPWEDGVPFVTQCPITSNSKFRYDFLADTSGTHFYHSHSALQLFDGLSGPFVVRTSTKTDPVSSLYDYDLFSHTIQIRDWFHEIIDVRYPGYNRNHTYLGLNPASYIINGKGTYGDVTSRQRTTTPLAEFVVKKGFKYRFRIITDTSTTCSLQFAIQDHPMLLIAADGYPVRPVMVRSLFLTAADIYDVVIDANQPVGAYWIRVQGYGSQCSPAVQQAILRYEGSGSWLPPAVLNTPALFNAIWNLPEFNNVVVPCYNNDDNLCLVEINAIYKAPERILEKPDQTFILVAGTYQYSVEELFEEDTYDRFYLPYSGPNVIPLFGGMYDDTINKISNMFTPFPLLANSTSPQINQLKCPDECPKYCECLNLLKLGLNNVVEIVFYDSLSSPLLKEVHPFHIHGHHWYIMEYGDKLEYFLDPLRFQINSTDKYPVIRDSVPTPAGGYAVVRFIADNPGFWLLHCHFTAHNDDGMQVVLQVGEPEMMPKVPKNWPTCGNYLPTIY